MWGALWGSSRESKRAASRERSSETLMWFLLPRDGWGDAVTLGDAAAMSVPILSCVPEKPAPHSQSQREGAMRRWCLCSWGRAALSLLSQGLRGGEGPVANLPAWLFKEKDSL